MTQEEKRALWRRNYRRYHPAQPPRTFYSEKHGRIVHRNGSVTSIFWSADMLYYLRKHFATTRNNELAGCLGVSCRTMIRKARELGLQKDRQWLSGVYNENRMIAHHVSRKKGFPGCFKKGHHASPATEFKPKNTLAL